MNKKLLGRVIEQLYRDHEFTSQETQTAVNMFFCKRANVDDLLAIINGPSGVGVDNYRRATQAAIDDLVRKLAVSQMEITDLEGKLQRAELKLKLMELDEANMATSSQNYQDRHKRAKNTPRYKPPENEVEKPLQTKKPGVYSRGVKVG